MTSEGGTKKLKCCNLKLSIKGVMMLMNITTLLSIGTFVFLILNFVLTIKRDGRVNTNTDVSKEIRVAESFKELNVKLDFQSKQLEELNQASRASNKELQELTHKTIYIDNKLTTAFKQIDELKERVAKLEERKE